MKKINSICTENIVAVIMFLFAVLFPLFNSAYTVDKFTNFYIACLLSLSLTLIWGYAGIFSFGQAAFYGVGAYTYAIISQSSEANMTWIALLCGAIIPFLFALILGYFIFYGGVSEVFTGIITMCISLVMQTFMVQTSGSQYKILGVWLGGFNGLNNIPKLHIGSFIIKDIKLYFFVVLIVFAVYVGFRILTRSRIGYAMFGVRESKARSELFGYKTAKIQTLVFAAGGALAGLGGVLFSSWSGYVVPTTLSVAASTIAVVMVTVAGRKNATGTIIMTVLYSWFTQKLASAGSKYSNIILGVLLIVVVIYLRDGLSEIVFNTCDGFASKVLRGLFKKDTPAGQESKVGHG